MDYLNGLSKSRIFALLCCAASLLNGVHLFAGSGPASTNAFSLEVTLQLFDATGKGDPSAIRAAITNGANVNARNPQGLTPLLLVFHGAKTPLTESQHQSVAILLDNGAGNGAADPEGRTALICAARLGDLESIRQLVEDGAYVKARDSFHKTALFYAVEMKRRDIVVYLAANGDLQSMPYPAKKQDKK